MLRFALAFLVIALVAAVFGFSGIVASATGIAQILFLVFVFLGIASVTYGLVARGTPGRSGLQL